MVGVSLIVSYGIIFYLAYRKLPIWAAVFSGAIVLSLSNGAGLYGSCMTLFRLVLKEENLELLLGVYFIGVFGNMLQSYGVADKMLATIKRVCNKPKILLFVFPSILSLLSATGSAIVAAPIIDDLGKDLGLSEARKAAINLFLRHVWYQILPVSVPLIYAAFLAGIPIMEFARVNIGFTLVSLAAGWFVYLAPAKERNEVKQSDLSKPGWSAIGEMALYLCPFIALVLLFLFLPFYIAVGAACIAVYLLRRQKVMLIENLLNKLNASLVLSTLSILYLKDVMDNIPDIQDILRQLTGAGIPYEALLILLPLLAGFFFANPMTVVAALYPLLLPLAPREDIVITASVIYLVGFVSYFISPLHLCQILTLEYFKVKTLDLYREYRITVPVFLLSGILSYVFFRVFAP